MKTVVWVASLVLATAGLATACSDSKAPGQGSGGAPGPGKKGPPPPVLVELAAVEAGDLVDEWTFLGQAQPALSAELAAAVAGHVISVGAREGDSASKGQTLLTIDSAKIRAELAAAQAQERGLVTELELAKRQVERVSKLDYPTISEPERERFELDAARVEAQLLARKAEIRRLQVELTRHTVKAPFAGIIAARVVDPGAWVSAGQTVLTLVSLDQLEVHVNVSAELGGRISVGNSVKLVGPTTAEAEIAGIVGALDTATRTMLVRLVPKERPSWLLSGMAVDVAFPVSLAGRGVMVPRDAIIRGPVESRVIAFVDGQGKPITVEIVATTGDKALVRAQGLAPGDRIVVRGNERWRPGQPMKTAPAAGQPDNPATGQTPGAGSAPANRKSAPTTEG